MTNHEIVINGTVFYYVSISINQKDLEMRAKLIADGFFECCLWGEMVSFNKFK